MPVFNKRGLVGIELPQEEAEADSKAGDVGAEDETSMVRASREVVVLDGDDGGGRLHPSRLSPTTRLMTPTPRGRRCLWRRG